MTAFPPKYYPTLCIRRGEMVGLEHLDEETKDLLLPIILFSPWMGSHQLANSHQRIERAFGNRDIILDLDRHYSSRSNVQSRLDFRALVSGDDSHLRWVDLIASHENYIPTVQIVGNTEDQISHQLSAFSEMGRGVVLRANLSNTHELARLDYSLGYYIDRDETDLLVVLDVNYQADTTVSAVSAAGVIDRVLETAPFAKFVVTEPNFPNSFGDFDPEGRLPIASVQVHQALPERFSNYPIYYGDWASTKPRYLDQGGGGVSPIPHIELPTDDSWLIFRSSREDMSYAQVARRIILTEEWADRPFTWGTGMIERAAGDGGGISTGPDAIAARVNIHLFMQAHRDNPERRQQVITTDWIDPI